MRFFKITFTAGAENAKKLLQEIVILPYLRPEVLKPSFHVLHNLLLNAAKFCIFAITIVHCLMLFLMKIVLHDYMRECVYDIHSLYF